jgi:hypothetical protein
MIKPIEGAILQVSAPTLAPCGCWATAGETNAAASAISTVATKCLNMFGFLKLIAVACPHRPEEGAVYRFTPIKRRAAQL